MWKPNKRVMAFLCILLVISLSGCGSKKDMVFHVSGRDLTYEETLVFGFIYTKEYNINDADSLNDVYEGGISYGEYYKQQLKDEIVNTMLLASEAKSKGIKLSSDEKDDIETDVKGLVSYYGKDYLDSYNIEEKDMEAVFEMKKMADKYKENLVETESDKEEPERYVRVYQVTFPTAKLDEAGGYVMDEEGNVEMLDESLAAAKKGEAEEFLKQAKNGEDMEKLLKEYDSSVTGAEKYLKYKDLSEEYKRVVDGLSVNQIGGPVSFNYGYYVVKMLEQNGEEYAKALSDHEQATNDNATVSEEIKRLNDSKIGNSTEYVEEVWETIEIKNFMK